MDIFAKNINKLTSNKFTFRSYMTFCLIFPASIDPHPHTLPNILALMPVGATVCIKDIDRLYANSLSLNIWGQIVFCVLFYWKMA